MASNLDCPVPSAQLTKNAAHPQVAAALVNGSIRTAPETLQLTLPLPGAISRARALRRSKPGTPWTTCSQHTSQAGAR